MIITSVEFALDIQKIMVLLDWKERKVFLNWLAQLLEARFVCAEKMNRTRCSGLDRLPLWWDSFQGDTICTLLMTAGCIVWSVYYLGLAPPLAIWPRISRNSCISTWSSSSSSSPTSSCSAASWSSSPAGPGRTAWPGSVTTTLPPSSSSSWESTGS